MATELVLSWEKARQNILSFEAELAANPKLAEIMSYGRAWYASREDGRWRFGPSKFVGYERNSARRYLEKHEQRDGRLTERVLSQWFVEVTPNSALYPEILSALQGMFAGHGKSPNRLIRLNVLKSDLDLPVQAQKAEPRISRITVNSEICSGRPSIRGMRIRVSDVLDLLASGNDRTQILEDYPYLEAEDIDAALEYAAEAVNHRVIRAA